MRRRFVALCSLAGLILSFSGVSSANAFLPLHASRTTPSALNLTLGDLSKPQSEFLPSLPARRETNAKRLARGLSPNRPRTYYNAERNARGLRARQSPTPCPIPRRQGVITIVFPRADSGPGFLGKDDYLGMYQFTTEIEDALQVSLGGCEEDISAGSVFHIETTNGLTNYPYLGASKSPVATSADLTAGSYNNVIIDGTIESDQGPAQDQPSSFRNSVIPSQSAMWTFSSAVDEVNRILPAWTNSDGSINTQLTIVFVVDGTSNTFQITGDPAAYAIEFRTEVFPAIFMLLDIVL